MTLEVSGNQTWVRKKVTSDTQLWQDVASLKVKGFEFQASGDLSVEISDKVNQSKKSSLNCFFQADIPVLKLMKGQKSGQA